MDEKMNIMPQYPIPSYKYGGIHIKKKNISLQKNLLTVRIP